MFQKIEKIESRGKDFYKNLWAFLKEYSVVGLAIGMVLGQITKELIDSMVKGVLTPLINLIISGDKVNALSFMIGSTEFNFGPIVSSLLTFTITLVALYIIVKKILKEEKGGK